MSMASPRYFGPLPVCSHARGRLAAFPAGRAKRAGKAEGKIKETGTTLAGFLNLLLSAHWLGGPGPAPWFSARSAEVRLKALALLDFDRHYSRISAVCVPQWHGMRS